MSIHSTTSHPPPRHLPTHFIARRAFKTKPSVLGNIEKQIALGKRGKITDMETFAAVSFKTATWFKPSGTFPGDPQYLAKLVGPAVMFEIACFTVARLDFLFSAKAAEKRADSLSVIHQSFEKVFGGVFGMDSKQLTDLLNDRLTEFSNLYRGSTDAEKLHRRLALNIHWAVFTQVPQFGLSDDFPEEDAMLHHMGLMLDLSMWDRHALVFIGQMFDKIILEA